MKLHEMILHGQTCVCDCCRNRRRHIRLATVSLATYNPSLDPEPPPLASFTATIDLETMTPGYVLAETLEPADTLDA